MGNSLCQVLTELETFPLPEEELPNQSCGDWGSSTWVGQGDMDNSVKHVPQVASPATTPLARSKALRFATMKFAVQSVSAAGL